MLDVVMLAIGLSFSLWRRWVTPTAANDFEECNR